MTLPRFRLRTLLLGVAVVCLLAAWQASVVSERRRMLDELTINGCYWSRATPRDVVDRPRTIIPMARSLLGDVAIGSIFLDRSPLEPRYREIHFTFPEAMMPIE
jgi:hypothetical protein